MKLFIPKLVALIFLSAFLGACDLPPAPTPEITADGTADSVPDSTSASSTPVSSTSNLLVSLASGYKIELPPAWRIRYWRADNVGDETEGDETEGDENEGDETEGAAAVPQGFADAQAQLGIEQDAFQFVDLVAQKQPNESDDTSMSLTVTVVPHNGLSLQDYLAAASEQVEHNTQATIKFLGFDENLRKDAHPVGILAFDRDEWTHQQLILFNRSADRLIVLSFVSPISQAQNMTPSIELILDSLQIQ